MLILLEVYVTGISNGGFMTASLACQLNNRIAAVAIVAATLDIGEGYDLDRPMPAFYTCMAPRPDC
jgi:polyhydroxybutyrate depolymerase